MARGPLDITQARELTGQLTDALCYLHQPPRRLVHCDIKPANILRVGARWKLADFGIAHWLGDATLAPQPLFASRQYAPPEAAERVISPAWDCWSLGVILREALARETQATPETLPAPFDAIACGCLNNAPDARWSAEQVRDALSGAPRPTTVATASVGNLPRIEATFIGRKRERDAVHALLANQRLVTLTGAGGFGKTRLAIETASRCLHEYPDGAWMVQYAPLRNVALVAPALATALYLPCIPGEAALESILDFLHPRRLLLLLDNCEHLLSTCAELVKAILRACPQTRILTTSREPLRVDDEATFLVPTLRAPPLDPCPLSPTALRRFD